MTLQGLFARLGLELKRKGDGYWAKNPDFMALYERIKPHTLVSEHRCYMLYQLAHAARHIAGDVAQLGVYKGGTAKMLAEVVSGTGKHVLLFDTFEGLPGQTELFADTNIESVRRYFADHPNVQFFTGYFPDTAQGVNNTFSFVYLDADLEKSIADGLEFFYPKMSRGGLIVVDDYGSKYWPGVKRAVDSFAALTGVHPIHTADGQCVLIKH